MDSTIQDVERGPTPPLLPILRSQQQADLLASLLGDPDRELSLSDLAATVRVPFATVHREIERAERAGIVTSRKVGNVRLVRANTESPYFMGLSDVLVKAFGPPQVIATALAPLPGVEGVYLYGSWAARYVGDDGARPVGDIDVLVLGQPDRDALYRAAAQASERLGRDVQVTVRAKGWFANGEGSFHDTVMSRPLVQVLPERRVLTARTARAAAS